ncbi:MAG: hypothetical protein H0U53_11080 [Actinobacteria bacterium]|nr:hypothetical protein [Actinomycetota bacterium]
MTYDKLYTNEELVLSTEATARVELQDIDCDCDGPCGSYVHDAGEEEATSAPSAAAIRYSIERSW